MWRVYRRTIKDEDYANYKEALSGGFIGVPEMMKTMQITKRHLMQLQLKLDNLKEGMNKN